VKRIRVQPDWGYFEWTEQIISINPYKLTQTFFCYDIEKYIWICTRQTLTIGFYSASSLKQQTVVCSTRPLFRVNISSSSYLLCFNISGVLNFFFVYSSVYLFVILFSTLVWCNRLACPSRMCKIVCSNTGQVKPKTLKLVFAFSSQSARTMCH
jgi:hypothetical protein